VTPSLALRAPLYISLPMSLVVTRFAPSPTGHLHIGGARTALFCWAFARRASMEPGVEGRFMIRIEDTDQARSSEESARGILEDLAWLGIVWDDGPPLKSEMGGVIGGDSRKVGPYFQAQRREHYDRYLRQLVEQGKAYPAFETTEELEVKRKAAIAAKQTYKYDRAAWRQFPTPEARLSQMAMADAAGKPYVIRFFVPDEPVRVVDEVLGEIKYAAGEVDDFVIRKADGFPTYHFAVVVDDELMGVTHVLRAQEHLNNTPRHVALQNALGFRTPVYAHMPLIINMDNSKMSKRDRDKAVRSAAKQKGIKDIPRAAAEKMFKAGAPTSLFSNEQYHQWLEETDRQLPAPVLEIIAEELSVQVPEVEVWDFRRNGYLPEAITNFIALLGWSPGMKEADGKDVEKFGMQFLAQHFALDRIGKTSARFDRVKLMSFNQDYIKALTDTEFERRWREWCREYAPEVLKKVDSGKFPMLAAAMKPRARTFADAVKGSAFALVGNQGYEFDPKAVEKVLKKGEPRGFDVLRDVVPALAGVQVWEPGAIQATIDAFCATRGVGIGAVAQPLRVALTGSAVSPPLGETLAILGKDATLARIQRCFDSQAG
jgi:glutamyl/glutaminyl-tRNA synthetase